MLQKGSEINKFYEDSWFFRYELAEKPIVDNYGHFMMYVLLDVAQAADLRSPVWCNLTGVKANLGQPSEIMVSILKLNRDTGYYWWLSCLHDMRTTVHN